MFGERDTLVIYSYMFGPQREAPCPMCTSLMGGLDHKVADIRQRVAVEMDPLWLVLDTTPEGRGIDWRPALTY